MTINYKAKDRKPLVDAVSKFTGEKAVYQKVPTYAYKIGNYTVTKEGNLECDESVSGEEITMLMEFLSQHGYTAPQTAVKAVNKTAEEVVDKAENEPQNADVGLTVSMPRGYFKENGLDNLKMLIDSKSSLIKKALGIDELPIEVNEDTVSFPWFGIRPEDSTAVDAYVHFIYALCELARNQSRINKSDKQTDNEKYTFRCFLLRLGFIGEKYKAERKVLMKNLSGSAAFKRGARSMFPSKEIVEKMRSEYPIGTRVELVKMDDPQAPPPGTKGTVVGVDDIASLLMKWDNGSSLNVVYGEDIIKKI